MTTYSLRPRNGRFGLVLGLAFAALACTGVATGQADTAAPAPATTNPTPTTPASSTPAPADDAPAASGDDALVSCEVDADCVVVEMGCCDICNGGFMMSVAKDQKDAAIARWHDTDCSGACTERGCDWKQEPVCDAGTCARTEDRGGGKRMLVKNRDAA